MFAASRELSDNITFVNTYLLIGIIIWLAKVGISAFLICSSKTRYLETRSLLILLVFFSPNILFWPINILLDIYVFTKQILNEYSIY
jgi:hypothetical protein